MATLYLHPRIHSFHPDFVTQDNPTGLVDALYVNGEQAECGAATSLQARYPQATVVRPKAAAILPGLIDSHAHLTSLGLRPGALSFPGTSSQTAIVKLVEEAIAKKAAGEWIVGRGWDQNGWTADLVAGFPVAATLDSVSPHNPVMLHRIDAHAVWLNTAALTALGFDRNFVPPAGGEALRDNEGELTGVFKDAAMDLALTKMPPPSDREVQQMVETSIAHFASLGVTTVHCALVEPWMLPSYKEVLTRLKYRVLAMVYAPNRLAEWASQNSPEAACDGRLLVHTLKMFADGALGSRGAWMFDDFDGYPGERGFPVDTPEMIREVAKVAAERGWQLATHAIGDRAIHEVLKVYTEVAGDTLRSRRWRVEHFQHTTEADIKTAAEAGVVAPMQPIHATADGHFARVFLGPERTRYAYALRRLLDAGVEIPLGSDYPIESASPWLGMQSALRRLDRDGVEFGQDQALSRVEALWGYTRAAQAAAPPSFAPVGQIGPLADFIAVDRDPLTCSVDALGETTVNFVCSHGQVIHGTIE